MSRPVCLAILFLLSPLPRIVGQEVDNQAPVETLDVVAPEKGGNEAPAVEPEEEDKPAEPQSQATSEALAEGTVAELSKPEVLQFNFSGTRWLDVLDWFASQADLALQVDQPPIGTFSFSDPSKTYTIAEGLDVINLALMKRGYSLVRRGRMLQVIDLEVENADKLISEIAELVTPDSLDERGRSDIVSCVFPLGSMTPDAAKTELALMIGPWGRLVVLDSARQVKVTETAEKLIAIRDLLKTAAMADTDVIEIILKNRSAEELLELARPLLELEPGENASDEIRISVGLFGEKIYASGLPGKTGLLQSIIEKADQPLTTATSDQESEMTAPVFQTHVVSSSDSATVFDVLQTLLAGSPDARIAIDPKTNAIVAWARPETHQVISKTISEMEGSGTTFKVVDLKRLDPAQALLTINKFFGITEEGGEGPVVDGDPVTGKLWVRGTSEQIELVENLLSELEGSDAFGSLGDKVRVLPYTGSSAQQAFEQIQGLWQATGRTNRIRTVTPARGGGASGGSGGIPDRMVPRAPVVPKQTDKPRASEEASFSKLNAYQFVTQVTDEPSSVASPSDQGVGGGSGPSGSQMSLNVDGADIIVQFTPAGMVIASEDSEALDVFQGLMESFASPSTLQSELPTIIWLKYIEAEIAAELVSSVLGGGESTIASAVDTVTGGLGGGMLGLLGMGMGGGGGGGAAPSARSILTSTGSVNIVPDARLNALIIHANPIDMQMIEMILEKIDIQESPEDIETVAKPMLIPVIYQDANDVANVVKSVFGERIAGAQRSSSGGGRGGQPSPQDFFNALRGGGGRGGASQAAKSERTKISVAVDAKSNSLVVIATPQDFAEIQQLVEALDQSSMVTEETIITYAPSGKVNPDVLKAALESILGTQAKSTSESPSSSSSSNNNPSSPSTPSSSPSPEDIQRRIEFFRSRFGGGGGAGGPGSGGGFRGMGGGRPSFGGGDAGGASGGGRPSVGRPGGGR
ncbi:MAG: secretin N-terminal domain-containing protein [Planctomycetota bacterium]|nr:secretin N-terminal domain-containing protein [Planctomycetota bacterium]